MAYTLINTKDGYFKLDHFEGALYHDYNSDDGVFEFKSGQTIGDNQVFAISNFSSKDYCPELLKSTLSTAEYDTFTSNMQKKYLVNINGDRYYFQRITKGTLKPKRYLRFVDSKTTFEQADEGRSITIFDVPDAIYDKKNDKLFFVSFSKITSLFSGITELYREATEQEVNDFLSQHFVQLGPDFGPRQVKVNNRKRIATLTDKYNSFSDTEKKSLNEYIQSYESDLPFKNGKFILNSDADLKKLLYGVDQRYYTTPIDQQKMIASSTVIISG